MSYKSKIPPYWFIPTILKQAPRIWWANRNGDYETMMKHMRGVLFTPKFKARAFKDYTPTAHDIFVCTYSKSGTYWMLQLVTQIAGLGTAEFDHIHDIVPWPETPMPGLVKLRTPSWLDSQAQKRAIKTHNEAHYVPYNSQATYIIVMRDPKDALVSAFYFADSFMPGIRSLGLSHWAELFVADKTIFGSWPAHIASFWPWRERDNVLITTFAEMKRDLEKTVCDVAALMEVALTEVEIAQVVERSGFAHMKAIEEKFSPTILAGRNPQMMRTGNSGEAKALLTLDELSTIDREMKAQLQLLGSDFPYDAYFGYPP